MSENEPLYNNILYIDKQEPVNDKLSSFIAFGLNVKQTNLQKQGLGDYYYQHENGAINIERKTQSDFDGSVTNSHIWDQADIMMNWAIEKENRYPYVLFVGDTDVYNDYAKITMNSRVGAMGSITGRGVPVIPISSEESFNFLIYKFIRMLHEDKFGKTRYVDLFKYKNPDMAKLGLDEKILRLLPGVGAQKAFDVSEAIYLEIKIKSKDPELGDYDALLSVVGVGKKTADNIYDILERDEEIEFEEDVK